MSDLPEKLPQAFSSRSYPFGKDEMTDALEICGEAGIGGVALRFGSPAWVTPDEALGLAAGHRDFLFIPELDIDVMTLGAGGYQELYRRIDGAREMFDSYRGPYRVNRALLRVLAGHEFKSSGGEITLSYPHIINHEFVRELRDVLGRLNEYCEGKNVVLAIENTPAFTGLDIVVMTAASYHFPNIGLLADPGNLASDSRVLAPVHWYNSVGIHVKQTKDAKPLSRLKVEKGDLDMMGVIDMVGRNGKYFAVPYLVTHEPAPVYRDHDLLADARYMQNLWGQYLASR